MENSKSDKGLIAKILGIVGIIAFIAIGIIFFQNRQSEKNPPVPTPSPEKSSISGTVSYSALIPDPEDAEKGSVTIKYRKFKSTGEYLPTNITLPVKNNVPWNWDKAERGQTYEMISELIYQGKSVKQSEAAIVTAPAQNINLALHVTWEDLPESVLEANPLQVTGVGIINGYIPAGSTYQILAKESTSQNFQVTQTFNSPLPRQTWIWKNAVRGKEYNVRANLLLNGQTIGTTGSLTAIAGDNNVTLILTSQAKPPSQTSAVISGTIYLNGPIEQNSSLLLLARTPPGTGEFNEIGRINNPNPNGQAWQWSKATSGTPYEITVNLQVDERDTAKGRTQIVTAPAENVDFTINTGVTIDTPTQSPSLSSCTQVGSNVYDATISWPIIPNMGYYWFQIGDGPGSSNSWSEKVPAGNNSTNLTTTLQIFQDKYYYAQYAVSTCTSSGCASDAAFSNFSSPFKFFCGNQPVE